MKALLIFEHGRLNGELLSEVEAIVDTEKCWDEEGMAGE